MREIEAIDTAERRAFEGARIRALRVVSEIDPKGEGVTPLSRAILENAFAQIELDVLRLVFQLIDSNLGAASIAGSDNALESLRDALLPGRLGLERIETESLLRTLIRE